MAALDQLVVLSPVTPTPVQPMDRLGEALGLPAGRLWVKRDDLTGLGGGGNKVRSSSTSAPTRWPRAATPWSPGAGGSPTTCA